MNLNTIVLLLISTLFLNSCADYKTDRTTKKKEKQYYSSMGFALIYSDHHYLNKVVNKKIKNDDSVAMHNLLKINTPIKIINPDNSKFIETKIYKKADYPKIFNVVISRKIASFLELDFNNPYVEIIETKKNKTFIAKKSETFEEEKNVSVLVLASSVEDKEGPGPIISSILTKNYKRLSVPVMIVPGNFSKEHIKQIG